MDSTQDFDKPTELTLPFTQGLTTTDINTFPVIEEQLLVEKRVVETGRLLVNKTVVEEEQTVDVPLTTEAFSVERVTINQYVDAPPAVRYDGDTTVFPVLKEVLITEKRLLLVEEVHVTRRQTTTNETQRVMLRREEVTVQRVDSEEGRSV
ncbi:YsnF/AvaK domain-containing protein [Spirosoma arcticum]